MNSTTKIFVIVFLVFFAQFVLRADDKVKVDYTSDLSYMVKIDDATVMKLVGNVYFYHNGAIINCDTAYYFLKANKFEGLGNVIINQDSMYVYGDRVTYVKDDGSARVFAPLIKVVDSTTVMYTRNLIYNTNTSVGEYFGGATVDHKSNTLESQKGFYDSKRSLVMLRDSVAIINDDYIIKTDSVDFYLNTEELDYECRSYIWRSNGDFLQSDKGKYIKSIEMFQCEENSYAMTKEQELWADSIKYYTKIDEAILNRNIQILDTVKKIIAFGDYGQYWKNQKNILMTQKPSVLNYTQNEEKSDTIYYSSDTLFIRPFIPVSQLKPLDSVAKEQSALIAMDKSMETRFGGEINEDRISIKGREAIASEDVLQESMKIDSLEQNILPADSLTNTSNVADSTINDLAVDIADNMANTVVDTLANTVVDNVADSVKVYDVTKISDEEIELMTKIEYKFYKKKLREHRKLVRKEKYLQWLRDGGMAVVVDTVSTDSSDIKNLSNQPSDGIKASDNFVEIDNIADSSDYIIRGFSNSKIFRNDVQLVCDTVISETVDSTTTFIGTPIMWNANNQITAVRIRSYSQNKELYRSRLFGNPILAQEIVEKQYSQLGGKTMDIMYRNNSIYRLYINLDADALIYKESEPSSKVIESLIHATSVNAIVDFDSMEISTVRFFTDIKTITYPVDKIADDQILELPNFKWQPERRPAKSDVFDRTIRESYRSDALKVTQPIFDITSSIENDKKEFIKNRTWRDRSELIPPSKKRFVGFD